MEAMPPESLRLQRDVEWALERSSDPTEVLPLLHRLARAARPGTDESIFAYRGLAELLVERHPWRATLYARKVLAYRPEDDRAWALVALSQTLLGHFKYAASAYRNALTQAPQNPWYAHNLGHLLDVALGQSAEALVWLERARTRVPSNKDVAVSFVHALAQSGDLDRAKSVYAKELNSRPSREQVALGRWLDAGAPERSPILSNERTISHRVRRRASLEPKQSAEEISPPARPRRRGELALALSKGLERLPFDAKQRTRANILTRDAAANGISFDRDTRSLRGLAAAIAYAIVYVDGLPLTQAEVAATFRVSLTSIRSSFAELRAQLALTKGDARYATPQFR